MQNNLRTTISAYVKLSPSELDKYVKRADLDTELADYVKEAPADGFTYGRKDKQWVELEASAVRNIRIRWGTSKKPVLDGEDIVGELISRDDIYQEGADVYTKTMTINVAEDSYVWFCCSRRILAIYCELSEGYMGPWDYQLIPDGTVMGTDGVAYYCYRTESMLSAGHSWKTLVKIKAHRDSD